MAGKTLLIQDPPYSFNKKKIKNHFSAFGTITDVDVEPSSTTCLVTFATSEQAQKAKIYGMEWNDTVLHIKTVETSRPSKLQRQLDPPSPHRGEVDSMESERSPKPQKAARKSSSKVGEKKAKPKEDVGDDSRDFRVLDSSYCSKVAASLSEKLQVLEERDRQLRQTLLKDAGTTLVGKTQGICPDMCPEKERILRDVRGIVSSYEMIPGSSQMDHDIAVKEYARSSADQDEPLPHELRPEPILTLTMAYMITNIMVRIEEESENKGEWFDFCWGRLRAIRKDIIQQQLCDLKTVSILEQCARFHISCFDFMWGSDKSFFDEKMNLENIGNCLQSLIHMYEDLRKHGVECPNEAEFNGYMILLKLDSGYLFSEYRQYQKALQESSEMKDVVNIHIAFHNNNYSKFFNLVNKTTYLNACLMQRYFKYVRAKALEAIVRSYCPPNKKVKLPAVYVQKALRFDSIQDTVLCCSTHGISVLDEDLRISRRDFTIPDTLYNPNISSKFVRKKRISIAQAVVGEKYKVPVFTKHTAHSSFTSDDILKPSAINADDQKERLEQVLNNQDVTDEPMSLPEMPIPDSPLILKQSSPVKPVFSFALPPQQPVPDLFVKEDKSPVVFNKVSSNKEPSSVMDVDLEVQSVVKPPTPPLPQPPTPKISRTPVFAFKTPVFSLPPVEKVTEKETPKVVFPTPPPVFKPPVQEKEKSFKMTPVKPYVPRKKQKSYKVPEKKLTQTTDKQKVSPRKEKTKKNVDDITMKKLRKGLSENLKKVSARKYLQVWKSKVESMRKARLEYIFNFTQLSTKDHLKCWGSHKSNYTHTIIESLESRNRANWMVKHILETNIHDLGPNAKMTGKRVVDALGQLASNRLCKLSVPISFNPVFWKLVFVLPKRIKEGSTFPSKLRHWCQQSFYSSTDFYLGDVECHISKCGIPVFLCVNVIEALEGVSLLKESSAFIFVTAQGWETREETENRIETILSLQSNKVSVGVLSLGDEFVSIDFSNQPKVDVVGQSKWLNIGTTQMMLLKLCEKAVITNFKISPGHLVIDKMVDKFFDLLHEDKYIYDCLFNALSEPNSVIILYNSFIDRLKSSILNCYEMKFFATPWEMKAHIVRRYPDVKFPKDYNSPTFIKSLKDQFSRLNLPLLRWPIGNSRQILELFKNFCQRLGIPQIFSKIIRAINPPDDDDPDSDLEYHLSCVNWVSIVETIVKELVMKTSFTSEIVYLDEILMERCVSTHWWMEDREVRKSKVK